MNASPAMKDALQQIGALGARQIDLIRAESRRRILRMRSRTARRVEVNRFMAADGYWPLLRWLSDLSPRSFLSIDEARTWLRKEITRIGKLKAAGHWAYRDNFHRLPGLQDRLIVATYFARYGAETWAREAA